MVETPLVIWALRSVVLWKTPRWRWVLVLAALCWETPMGFRLYSSHKACIMVLAVVYPAHACLRTTMSRILYNSVRS
jgi:hypothetical protein